MQPCGYSCRWTDEVGWAWNNNNGWGLQTKSCRDTDIRLWILVLVVSRISAHLELRLHPTAGYSAGKTTDRVQKLWKPSTTLFLFWCVPGRLSCLPQSAWHSGEIVLCKEKVSVCGSSSTIETSWGWALLYVVQCICNSMTLHHCI